MSDYVISILIFTAGVITGILFYDFYKWEAR